jgi:hypothetical protein
VVGFFGSIWVLLWRFCVLVGFGFLGFFSVFLFSLSSFLPFGVHLYTFCELELRSSAFLICETLLIKKTNMLHCIQLIQTLINAIVTILSIGVHWP